MQLHDQGNAGPVVEHHAAAFYNEIAPPCSPATGMPIVTVGGLHAKTCLTLPSSWA